jgi:transaldolase / glucose-6-phosphate isomerase
MGGSLRNVDRLAGPNLDLFSVQSDPPRSFYNRPVLLALFVFLIAQAVAGTDPNPLHLVTGAFHQDFPLSPRRAGFIAHGLPGCQMVESKAMRLDLEDLDLAVNHQLRALAADRFASRLWKKDLSLWPEGPNALGWLDAVEKMRSHVADLDAFVAEVRSHGLTQVLLLGMGGSSLCPDLFRKMFGPQDGYPTLFVLDTTDPDQIAAVERQLDPKKTLVVVSSKSGTTIEVDSLYRYFRSRIPDAAQFVAITDEGTPLDALGVKEGFRRVFRNPSDIGGRFSALSFFGLVPAALMGLSIDRLLTNASAMASACGSTIAETENVGVILGALLGEAATLGREKLTLAFSPALQSLAPWVEQLIAESTGKSGKGIVPIVEETLEQRKTAESERVWIATRLQSEPAIRPNAKIPGAEIYLQDVYDVAGEFFRWEIATAALGHILNVNPFDQPNVEESKKMARQSLERKSEKIEMADSAMLNGFLKQAKPHNYIALLAFMEDSEPNRTHLQKFRDKLSRETGRPITFGFGPRYLHSTGQLHKGGANNGLFIQIVSDKKKDISVPGTNFSFGKLQAAQADGDYMALKTAGRRVIRVSLLAMD